MCDVGRVVVKEEEEKKPEKRGREIRGGRKGSNETEMDRAWQTEALPIGQTEESWIPDAVRSFPG